MITKTKSTKQNLITLLRRLRPLLPGNVEKVSPTEYLVNGRVEVELNYYCTWAGTKTITKEEKAKTCYPHSISVRPNLEFIRNAGFQPQTSSVFKARTISSKKNKDFSLESVATAVTKCGEAVDEYIRAARERRAMQDKRKADRNQEVNRLKKLVPASVKLDTSRYFSSKHPVVVWLDDPEEDGQPFRIRLEATVSEEQLTSVLAELGIV